MAIYKYLKKTYHNDFRDNGKVRLRPLRYYRDVKEKTKKDKSEGISKLYIADKEPVELNGREASKCFSPNTFSQNFIVMPNAHVLRKNIVQNSEALIFCTSSVLSDCIMRKLECDAYYEIFNPIQFAKLLCAELRKHMPILDYKVAEVRYVKKEHYMTKKIFPIVLGMSTSKKQ